MALPARPARPDPRERKDISQDILLRGDVVRHWLHDRANRARPEGLTSLHRHTPHTAASHTACRPALEAGGRRSRADTLQDCHCEVGLSTACFAPGRLNIYVIVRSLVARPVLTTSPLRQWRAHE